MTVPYARSLCLGLAVLALAGCAADHPPQRGGFRGRPDGEGGGPPGRQGRGPGAQASLFISPSGKPFRAMPGEPYPVAAWFAAADKNADGHITLAEFEADADAFFSELDRNSDGVIDGSEVEYYEQKMVPEIIGGAPERGAIETQSGFLLAQYGGRGGGGGGGGRGGGRGGQGQGGGMPQGDLGAQQSTLEGAGPYSLLGDPEPVASADADFNSMITRAEFRGAADRRFGVLDTKALGYLTLDDLPKTAMQSRGGGRRGPRGGGGRPPGPAA